MQFDQKFKLGTSIAAIYGIKQKSKISIPLYSCGVSAGFPSPAEDYIGHHLDFNELLNKNPASTFCVRVAGDSMCGAGINDHDILVVDRSIQPTNGKIIIAAVNGELTVKRLIRNDQACKLVAENPNYPEITITEDIACICWGVVTTAIHQF